MSICARKPAPAPSGPSAPRFSCGSLRIGIVGSGRLGSTLEGHLTSLGVRRLTLVDPDRVERSNCGEGGFFGENDLGHPKVHIIENRLAVSHPEVVVEAIAMSVTHRLAIRALARCHVIFCAADHPGARLAAAAVAACYQRVLVDVGTMIPNQSGDGPIMGGDARLVLPDRCLLCFGSVAQEGLGHRIVASPSEENAYTRSRPAWHRERAGSLYSLNQLIASVAARLLEDLAARRLTRSAWRQIDFARSGPRQPGTSPRSAGAER